MEELEEAKIRLIRDITKPLTCKDICVVSISDVETILQELERKDELIEDLQIQAKGLNGIIQNSIPKKKIEDKIEKLKQINVQLPVEHMKQAQINILQELLENK